jgi:MEMO1 family protein
MSDPLVRLAREAIRAHLTGAPPPVHLVPDPHRPCGVFVSIHEPTGDGEEGPLRGCVGTVAPREPTIAAEVARTAVEAATADPRFPPLRPDEVDRVEIEVYLLGEPEPVHGLDELDPGRYGVIVTGGNGRIGVLLPGIDGVDSGLDQVEIAAAKAG